MDDFHRAVLCTFEPTADAQLRNDALARLEALKASADGWTFCLQALSTSAEDRVKFWCLQALVDVVGPHRQNRYAALPEEQKQILRSALIAWVQASASIDPSRSRDMRVARPCRRHPESHGCCLQAKGAAGTDEAPFVKNKFAQLAVEVLKLDYPQLWPQVFPRSPARTRPACTSSSTTRISRRRSSRSCSHYCRTAR